MLYCFDNKDFVRQFNRLTGSSLGVDRRTALDRMIDEATGHEPSNSRQVLGSLDKLV